MSAITNKKAKRVGRGPGSGKGKTAGRGTKGQNARNKLPITHPHFEGGQRSLIKRLPVRRGKGNPKISKKPLVINLEALNLLPVNIAVVDLETLIKHGIVDAYDAKSFGVKILGDGNLKKPFTISLPISKSAAAKVEKSGGKIITIASQSRSKGEDREPSPSVKGKSIRKINKERP